MPNEFKVKNGLIVDQGGASITGSSNISGSLAILASGSSVFTVDGTAGRLFSVDDSLSGSLFSVNTVAGLPIMEAFSDNTVRIGQYGKQVLYVSQSKVGIGKEANLNGILDVSGSITVTGSLNVSSGITGSLFGTSSWAASSSFTPSASFATTASYALTASAASNFVVGNSLTASNALITGTITAQTLVVQTITASTEYSSGSNIFGSLLTDTQQFTGSVSITGSLSTIGTNTLIGNTSLTGSVNISGSTTQRGSNTLIGNTQLSGSIAVTGSQTFVGTNTITGSINISGSTVQIGNNTLLGNTLLSGSITISGSFPIGSTSSSVNIYGDTSMTGYLKFNPESTNIDTTISASYIFVSGSTQDLYFAQNTKGYANVTRLRWIEGNLYTGLLHGGLITTQSSTVYQVSSGSGVIVTINASIQDDPYPTTAFIEWSNLSASIAPLSASYDQSFIAIQPVGSTGIIYAQGAPYDNGQYNTLIPIGNVIHQNRSTINATATYPNVAYAYKQRSNDFIKAFGPLKISGLTTAVSGSSTGSLSIASGTAYSDGRNYPTDPNNPSYVIDSGQPTSKIYRYYSSGSGWVYLTNVGAGFQTIDPGQYNNNGTLATVLNNKWSIQRVFYFPGGATKGIYVYYGNAVYDSQLEAIANISTETFVEAPNTAAGAILSAYLILQGNANFTNTTTYTIRQAGLFRNVGGSGGGGSVTTNRLVDLSDVSITAPTDHQPFAYDATLLKWTNQSSISASISGNAETATLATNAITASYALTAAPSYIDNFITVGLTGSNTNYNSIKTAVDSITDATQYNTYTVKVYPGTYIEDTISMKSWIAVKGDSSISTVVSASNPSSSVFVMADQSMIIDLQVQGSTATSASAVYYSSPTTPQTNAISYVENVRFGTNYTHAKVVGTGSAGNCIMQCSNVKYGGYPFTLGFHATNTGSAGIGRMQLRNVTSTNGGVSTTTGLVFAKADQPGCAFIVNGALLTKAVGAAAGTGFWVENGASLRLTALNFQRWATAIYAPNTGSAPSIFGSALNFENNTLDLVIEHPSASGHVEGTDTFLKTQIPLNAPLYEVNQDPRRFTVAKKGGDFTSISASVAYITDSSATNRYVIEVGPGQFTENTIDLTGRPYVSIVGSNIQTTQIFPSSSTQHIIKLGINNEVSFLSLGNAGAGYAGLYIDDIGDFAQAHKISFYDCDTNVFVTSRTQDTQFYGEYLDFNGTYTYGTKVSASAGFGAYANIENYYQYPSGSIATIGNLVEGQGSDLNLAVASFDGSLIGVSGGTAIKLQNSASCDVTSTDIIGWDYGLSAPNIGGNSSFNINGTVFRDSLTYDFDIAHPTTNGRFQGSGDHTKINNASNDFFWSFIDITDGEYDITRKLSVTFVDGTHTDATTLIFKGSPMGVMQGGEITISGSLTINTAAGFGYLENTLNPDVYQRIDWLNSTLVLSPNSNNYIYLDETDSLLAASSSPDSTQNIILGRVVTNDIGIEFIDQSPYDGAHMSNKISKFNRDALGPVFADGSIVSENVTPFKLNVTQGSYFFSENNFTPSGTSSVNFTQYYRSASAWDRSQTSIVTSNTFDSGSSVLSPLSASAYTKHTLYLIGEGVDEEYFLVIGQNEYASLVLAEGADLPTPPTYFNDGMVPLASIYVRSGSANIIEIQDVRPVIGFRAAGVNASATHGNLLGLTADDHLQYLLVNGIRQMTGDLGLGGNDIFNADRITANSFTGSLFGTASWANNFLTSSVTSASFASTASYFLTSSVTSASFAATASSADNFLVRGTLTAQTIVAQTITSSTDFVTGSTRFGSLLTDTHQFTGSVSITGSLTSTGSLSNQGTVLITNSSGTGSIGMTSSTNSIITLTGFYNTGQTVMSLSPGGSDYFIDTYGAGNRLIITNNSGITLKAYSSATQYMHMSSAGVRIGGNDQTVSARLHVSGSDSSLFLINSSTAGSVFYVSGSGNVGIGTATPSYSLDINGTARVGVSNASGQLYIRGLEGAGQYIYLSDGTTRNWSIIGGTNYTIQRDGSSVFVINASNNVGIGTTNPSAKLHISGAVNNGILVNGISAIDLVLQAGNLSGGSGTIQLYAGTNNNSYIRLNGDYIREGAGGGLGVGASSRETITSRFYISGSNNDILLIATSSAGPALVVSGSGNVGIGTSALSARFNIRGSGSSAATNALLVQNSSGTTLLSTRDDGATSIGAGNQGLNSPNASFTQYVISTGTNGNVFGTYTSFTPSAMVEINSTTRGFLPSRTDLTSNISNPAQGLVTYLTGSTNEGLWYYSSGSIKAWTRLLNDTGSQSITGSLTATSFTGSLQGTASWATNFLTSSVTSASYAGTASVLLGSVESASYAATASWALNFITSSVTSASFASTASYFLTSSVTSASFAATASYVSASNVAGLSLSQITLGAVTASVNAGSNIFNIISASNTLVVVDSTGSVGIGTTSPGYKLDVNGTARVKGTGTSGATYGLTVINSASTINLSVRDDGTVYNRFTQTTQLAVDTSFNGGYVQTDFLIGAQAYAVASSVLELRSTTKGFLPPRMTTTQKNAIATPAAGLVVYDTDISTEGLWYYLSGSIKGWSRVLNDTGSQVISGSLTVTQGITGSLFGTASWANNFLTSSVTNATSASYAATASWATNFLTSSVTSASYAGTASVLLGSVVSASYAATASWALNFITGSVTSASFASTASLALNFITSSVTSASFASTASYFLTSSVTNATSASYAATSSWALNFITSSVTSASFASTASWALNFITSSVTSASFASTSSLALNFITGSVTSASYAGTASAASTFVVANSLTASNALITGTITAQTLVVQTITASVEYSSGSNIFGSLLTNTQQFTGSVTVTGSLSVVGQVSASGFTGSLFGTSSWSINSLTASYFLTSSVTSASFASTASIALNFITSSVTSASFASTASYFLTSSVTSASFASTSSLALNFITGSVTNSTSASYAATASWALNFITSSVTSASFASTSSWANNFITSSVTSASYAGTASVLLGSVVSASYASTASWALNFITSSVTSASFASTASWATNFITSSVTSASYAFTASSAVSSSFATTASYYQIVTGSAGNDVNVTASLSGSIINIPDASATARGLVTTGIQTFGGEKTFVGAAFTSNQANLYIPSVGFNGFNSTPYTFGGVGNTIIRVGIGGAGNRSSSTANPATYNYGSVVVSGGAFGTNTVAGNHPIAASLAITPFTTVFGTAGITTATTVYIQSAPSTTATNIYALWVDSGSVRLDGDLIMSGSNISATGSISATGGFTGSLFGTASWAQNVVGGGSSAITIADEGTAQGTATFLNFIGSGVTATVSANTGSITITSGGGLTTKAGSVANSSFTGNPKKATVTFSTAFPNSSYAITVTGEDARSWTIESKVAGSFVINANSNTALAGTTYWTAIAYGES